MNSKQHNMVQFRCLGCHLMYFRRASSQKLCKSCQMDRIHALKKAKGKTPDTQEGGRSPAYRKEVWATIADTLKVKPAICPKCQAPGHNLNVEFVMAYNDGRDVGWACMVCGYRVVPEVPSHFVNIRDPVEPKRGSQIVALEGLDPHI